MRVKEDIPTIFVIAQTSTFWDSWNIKATISSEKMKNIETEIIQSKKYLIKSRAIIIKRLILAP